MIKTVQGDLIKMALEGEFDAIVHGCNCFCAMGAGIAKQIKAVFPKAYEVDCKTYKGDKAKLGLCTFASYIVNSGRPLKVINAYTQYNYGRGQVNVDYEAVRGCMRWIAATFNGKSIGMPKIGAGLAGGDWERIYAIIEEEMGIQDVTIVEFAE